MSMIAFDRDPPSIHQSVDAVSRSLSAPWLVGLEGVHEEESSCAPDLDDDPCESADATADDHTHGTIQEDGNDALSSVVEKDFCTAPYETNADRAVETLFAGVTEKFPGRTELDPTSEKSPIGGFEDEVAGTDGSDFGCNSVAVSATSSKGCRQSGDLSRKIRPALSRRRSSDTTTLDLSVYETVLSDDESEFECASEEDDSVSQRSKPRPPSCTPSDSFVRESDTKFLGLNGMEGASPAMKKHTQT
ncbi:MAG: hypothetical protein SGARI_001036 [Bacillariaceae sp.]